MIARTVVAAAAAFMLVSTASAATLVVNAEPTLSNIVVELPVCGQATPTAGVSVTWTPERSCAVAPDEARVTRQNADSSVPEQPEPADSAPDPHTAATESDATGVEPTTAAEADRERSPEADAGPSEAKPSPDPTTGTVSPSPSAEADTSAVEPTGDAATPTPRPTPETPSDARPADE